MKNDPASDMQLGVTVGDTLISSGYIGQGLIDTLPDEEISGFADHIASRFTYLDNEDHPWFSYRIESAMRDHK